MRFSAEQAITSASGLPRRLGNPLSNGVEPAPAILVAHGGPPAMRATFSGGW